MTTPITYPSGQISPYGIKQALANQLAWITYTGTDGSMFYLAGPAAPVAGAQDGLILRKHMGLMAPFELLELKGARQDGGTWTDTVYEPGEIMFTLEATGTSPQNIRNVIRQWISAWDPAAGNPGHPTQLGTLSIFTSDMGEWSAPVRLSKNISDVFDKDYTYSYSQPFTWAFKNYGAFWFGPDSVSVFNGNTTQYVVTANNPLGAFALELQGQVSANINALAPGSAVQSALGALSNIGAGNVIVNEVVRSVWGVTYGIQFVGSLAGQLVAPLIAHVGGLINGLIGIRTVTIPQTGFLPLTNIGDMPAWPRYLCYGPGTFSFGNGPGSTSTITFGPLAAGQVVLVTTEPRLRSVIDLTPTQPPQQLTIFQTLMAQLISYATNNNLPPVLRRVESFFGIVPPQGNLYSLMSGRFTNPIPGSPYGTPPHTQYIPVGITGGNANSQIIGALTPMRRWPL